MKSRASLKDHPIHPMLVAFPIALWIFSLLCDLLYRFGDGMPIWNTMAFYTMLGGLVGALLAAIPGAIDLLALRDSRVKWIGITHMVLNLVVIALFSLNLWLRLRTAPGDTLPVSLSVIAVALLGLSGWLGGALVYVHRVGVVPGPEPGSEQQEERGRVGRNGPRAGERRIRGADRRTTPMAG